MNFVNFVNKCRLSIFLGKCLCFQENYEKNSAKYKPPGSLIEAIATGRLLLLSPWPNHVPNKGRCTRDECTAMNAMAETIALAATAKAAKAANRTEIVSPANEQYENRSKLLRYHYKQGSGIQAAA